MKKQGILKYVANSSARGCKFEDEPNKWYNPVNEAAKKQINKNYEGKLVEITLVEGNNAQFSSMRLFESEGEPVIVTEEQMGVREQPDPEVKDINSKFEEEKVPQTPPKEEEMRMSPLSKLLDMAIRADNAFGESGKYTCDVFAKMNETKVKIEKKGNLNYASWAEVWKELKKIHPRSTYKVYENKDGMPFFNDVTLGAFVKVSVTVLGVTHTVHLPVMTNSNKAAKGVQLDVVLINKNIQRALAKAIAMHGIGLYVYNGEDLPEDK